MDPMRAVAAFAILAFHTANTFGVTSASTTLRHFAGRLEVGVWIFFVISGFLLYRPFVATRVRGEPSPSLVGYAWRRFLRIFPGYWVALTLCTIWVGFPAVFTVANAPRLYLLVQNYWSSTYGRGLGQAWSLCVELAFYGFLIVFVFALSALARRRTRSTIRFELVAVVALIVAGVGSQLITGDRGLRYLPWYIDAFAAGMLLAVLSVHVDRLGRRPAAIRLIERAPILPWGVAFAAYYIAATQIGLTGDYRQEPPLGTQMLRSALYLVIATNLMLPVIWGEDRRGLIRRLLGTRPMRFAGRISYGVFLYQGAVLAQLSWWGLGNVVVPHFSYLLWFMVVSASTVVLATLSWYLIEAPALRRKYMVGGRPPPVRSATNWLEPAPAET